MDPWDASDETRRLRLGNFAIAMAVAAYEVSRNARSKRWIGWKAHIEGVVAYLNMLPGVDTFGLCHQ